MSIRDYTANVISASKVVPDGNFKNSKASGVWDINEALDLIKGGNWPNAANISPSAFVDALFSIDLWDGTGRYSGSRAEQTITNGIDFSTNGGMVYIKGRGTGTSNGNRGLITSTPELGVGNFLYSSENKAKNSNQTSNTYLHTGPNQYNTDGFKLGDERDGWSAANDISTPDYVGYSFRKQPKFFDIVEYTGNGSNRTIAHSLASAPGMILVKNIDQSDDWAVFHNGLNYGQSSNAANWRVKLNEADGRQDDDTIWNDTLPTSTVFSVGTDHSVNANGENYIAYLFAHNNNDGEFGPDGDQDIIKCGNFVTDSNNEEATIDLGFEPQWVFFKRINSSTGGDWNIYDNMRGMHGDFLSQAALLEANTSDDEDATTNRIAITPTGFKIDNYGANRPFIYVAIRRGGMQTPTAATNVFAIDTMANQTPAFDSTFPVDMVIRRNISGVNTNSLWTRLTGQKYMNTNAADVESNDSEAFDSNVGFGDGSSYSDNHAYMWARARGYFDVVTYTGNSTNNTEIKHNLGVVPEMVWTKQRNTDARNWAVYHSALGNTNTLTLDTNAIAEDNSAGMYSTPTATSLFLKASNMVNANGAGYIAHLFATVAGVSKVGSFTQSGATNVDCGFTGSTPALIILKRTDASGDFYLFDSLRGIVAGNDPYFILNDTTAPTTNADMVDPYSGGFATTSNIANGDYIFYAIAAIS